jgi:transposase InsO family protein
VDAELRGFGRTVNRKRVERLMRRHGLPCLHLRHRTRTMVPDRLASLAPDFVQRDFHVEQLNERGVARRHHVCAGRWHVPVSACVLDIGSRRSVRLVDGYTCAH